jgi:hypothetical protein
VVGTADGKSATLSLSGETHLPVAAPWQVAFPGADPVNFPTLVSWIDRPEETIRDFSGIATYQTQFTVPDDFLQKAGLVELDLGEVHDAARVWINGTLVGTYWNAPWRLPVHAGLHSGANTLKIEVANGWLNRLLADSTLDDSKRQTWTIADPKQWTNNAKPQPSGLIGPVMLVGYPKNHE